MKHELPLIEPHYYCFSLHIPRIMQRDSGALSEDEDGSTLCSTASSVLRVIAEPREKIKHDSKNNNSSVDVPASFWKYLRNSAGPQKRHNICGKQAVTSFKLRGLSRRKYHGGAVAATRIMVGTTPPPIVLVKSVTNKTVEHAAGRCEEHGPFSGFNASRSLLLSRVTPPGNESCLWGKMKDCAQRGWPFNHGIYLLVVACNYYIVLQYIHTPLLGNYSVHCTVTQ